MNKITISFSGLCFFCVSIVILFHDLINQIIPFFDYYDELLCVIGIIYILISLFTNNLNKNIMVIVILLLIIVSIGFVDTLIYRYNSSKTAVLSDVISLIKFPVFMLSGFFLIKNNKLNTKSFSIIVFIVKMFVAIGFVFCLVNLFYDVNMYTDYRYGLRAFNFIFSRVGELYTACSMFFVILLIQHYKTRNKIDFLFIILDLLLMISTLRTRAFAFAVLAFTVYIILFYKQFKMLLYLTAFIGVILVSYEQFSIYFMSEESSIRQIIWEYSFEVVNTHPNGAGFASYCSGATIQSYSNLYYKLGFNNIWGLSSDNNYFLSDNFWPSILGQYGYIGLAIEILIIYYCFKLFKSIIKNDLDKNVYLYIFLVLIINSIATSIFNSCLPYVFVLIIAFNYTHKNEKLRSGESYE